jgi:hypothetical protein
MKSNSNKSAAGAGSSLKGYILHNNSENMILIVHFLEI